MLRHAVADVTVMKGCTAGHAGPRPDSTTAVRRRRSRVNVGRSLIVVPQESTGSGLVNLNNLSRLWGEGS